MLASLLADGGDGARETAILLLLLMPHAPPLVLPTPLVLPLLPGVGSVLYDGFREPKQINW